MKSSIFSLNTLLYCLIFSLLSLPKSQAQLFEETISPTATTPELAVDGKQIPLTDHFIMVSNTFQYNTNLIALSELDVNGVPVQRSVVWMPGSTNQYFARSIEVVLTAAGAAAGYWITGSELSANSRRLILIQTTLTGVPICVRYLDNTSNGVVNFDEEGVSLERQSNGDVIVIGQSLQRPTPNTPATMRFIAARFPAACAPPVWSFRYFAPANYHLKPAESCNGLNTAQNVPVVAITGRATDPNGNSRTFGAMLDAATGNEIWRRIYNSGGAKDEGTDIVQNPANKKYMIVGRTTFAGSPEQLWVFNVAGGTGALAANTGAVYSIAGGGGMSGQDVCLSTAGNRAIIAGRCQVLNTAGGFDDRAFLIRLPFTNCANLEFFRHYQASTPVAAASESVVPVVAAGAAAVGYFMTTGGFPSNSGWTVNGAHPIYTDINGNIGFADCPTPTNQYVKTCTGTGVTLAKTKVAAPWVQGQLGWEIIITAIAACDGVLPAPKPAGNSKPRSNDSQIFGSDEFKTFPNPIAAGQILTIQATILEESKISIQLFDLAGKLILEKNENAQIGRLTHELETNELATGTYFLQIRTKNGVRTSKILVE